MRRKETDANTPPVESGGRVRAWWDVSPSIPWRIAATINVVVAATAFIAAGKGGPSAFATAGIFFWCAVMVFGCSVVWPQNTGSHERIGKDSDEEAYASDDSGSPDSERPSR